MSLSSHCDQHSWLWDDHIYVCTNCGLCTDCIPSTSSSHYQHYHDKQQQQQQQQQQQHHSTSLAKTQPKSKFTSNEKCVNKKQPFSFFKHASIMRELCSKLHIDGEERITCLIDDFASLYTYLRHRKDFSNSDIATLSLYKSLSKNDESKRPLKDICQISGADLKRIWKLQKYIELSLHKLVIIKPVTAEDVIKSRIGKFDDSNLTLTFSDFKVLKKLLNKTRHLHGDYSVNTISATAAYEYLNWKEKGKKNKISKKIIATKFQSTPTSISRYQSYLKSNNVTLTNEL